MDSKQWERLDELYHHLVDLDVDQRAAFLDELSSEDVEILDQLRGMLELEPPPGFMEPPEKVRAVGTFLGLGLEGRELGEFRLEREIGRGSMGIVYEAVQRTLGRRVAVKILPPYFRSEPGAIDRFRRECLAASRVEHPNVASVITTGEQEGVLFYAMELVEGGSLREALERRPADPFLQEPHAAAEFIRQVALALHAAHEIGVVHRDVNPRNILVGKDGHPKVIDFGLAQFHGVHGLTRSGVLGGTPAYMSPEQASANLKGVDLRTDVYSAGVVLYELITGERPFQGENDNELLQRIIEGNARRPRALQGRLPKDLEAVCVKATARDPEQRYGTALEFAEDLERFIQGRAVEAPRVSTVRQGLQALQRNPRRVAIPLLILLVLGLVAFLIARERDRANEGTGQVAIRLNGRGRVELFEQSMGPEPWLAAAPKRLGTWDGGSTIRLRRDAGRTRWILRDSKGGQIELSRELRAGGQHDVQVKLPLPHPGNHCPERMLTVPATRVALRFPLMQSNGSFTEHFEVYEVAPFRIDRAAVSVGEFADFLEARPESTELNSIAFDWLQNYADLRSDARGRDLPAVGMNKRHAVAFAEARGMRLPTWLEWLAATAAGQSSWLDWEPAEPFVLREEGDDRPASIAVYFEVVQPVAEGAQAPNGLFHPIGNITRMLEHGAHKFDQGSVEASPNWPAMSAGAAWSEPKEEPATNLLMEFGFPLAGGYGSGCELGFQCVSSINAE